MVAPSNRDMASVIVECVGRSGARIDEADVVECCRRALLEVARDGATANLTWAGRLFVVCVVVCAVVCLLMACDMLGPAAAHGSPRCWRRLLDALRRAFAYVRGRSSSSSGEAAAAANARKLP